MAIGKDANEGFAVPEPQSSVFKLNKALIMPFISRLTNGWGINNTIPKVSQKIMCFGDIHSYFPLEVGEIIMSNNSSQTICIPCFTHQVIQELHLVLHSLTSMVPETQEISHESYYQA